MFKKIKKFFSNLEERDYYEVELLATEKGARRFTFYQKINVSKGTFPSRRLVSKCFGEHITNTIKERRFKNIYIEVVIICKIGSFRKGKL